MWCKNEFVGSSHGGPGCVHLALALAEPPLARASCSSWITKRMTCFLLQNKPRRQMALLDQLELKTEDAG
ncbi:hypothetical protein CsSME_00031784 [Camellia sinensis var. sinensis]